jgi:hypothetical protein
MVQIAMEDRMTRRPKKTPGAIDGIAAAAAIGFDAEAIEAEAELHGPCERRARHLCCAPGDLDEKPDGGTLGTEDGLHSRATLPTDRCHLNDTAVRINRHHRDDTAVGEEYMVERTISVHKDLPAMAANVFKLRHKLLEIRGWQVE